MGNFLIKVTATGYKFDLLARNGRIIATSEVYQTLASCKVGISSVKRNAPLAAFCDLTLPCPKMRKNPKFELYQDRAGEFRLRLKAKNGEIIAVSEGYGIRRNCIKGIQSVRRNAPEAGVLLPSEGAKRAGT